MQEYDEVQWTAMTASLTLHGRSVEAFQLKNMVVDGVHLMLCFDTPLFQLVMDQRFRVFAQKGVRFISINHYATPCKDQIMLSGCTINVCNEEVVWFSYMKVLYVHLFLAYMLTWQEHYVVSFIVFSDLSVSSSPVQLYSKRGNIDNSCDFFYEIRVLASWAAVIGKLTMQAVRIVLADMEIAIHLYD